MRKMTREEAEEVAARALEIVSLKAMYEHGYDQEEVEEAIKVLAND